MNTVDLFSPLLVRGVTFKNRIGVSPMCQYSCKDGLATDWHLVHLGSRASGGAGLVFTEACAVAADGRISPQDLGIWKDDHIEGLARCVRFIDAQGGVAGVQLAHAGRKASTAPPWENRGAVSENEGGWRPVWAPSKIAFKPDYAEPNALTVGQIADVVSSFAAAARRAHSAGFRVVEIHAAHGYLLHQFLSPLSNMRTDQYGGSFENRTRIIREVTASIRTVWPDSLPLFIRLSVTDWVDGGWNADQSVELVRQLKPFGVDVVDCSSGGLVPGANIPVGPGYQIPFAERIRRETGIATAAVGLIRETAQANEVIQTGHADMVLLAREMLRDPYWALHAAKKLDARVRWPLQYERAAD